MEALQKGLLHSRQGPVKALSGHISQFAAPGAFNALISKLYKKNRVVYCKKHFEKTENVIDYLG